MTKDEFITERTRIISEMLDNPDKYGIYPTTKCFNALDKLFDEINLSNEAKIKEVTDEDIEMWANSKEKIIDEMPETLKLHITKKIECRIEGAKAFRDGEIK